jgi:hypothetical protein
MHFPAAMLAIALILGPPAPPQQFDEWNKNSTLSTDCAVELPGIVLEPGVYIFKLLQGNDKRSLVQIWNSDQTQIIATVVAIPDHRTQAENYATFTYHNIKGNGPKAIQSWYYPGDQVGLEFVYPKSRAIEIAKESEDRVMGSKTREGVIVAVTPNGKEIVIDEPTHVTQTARRKPQ